MQEVLSFAPAVVSRVERQHNGVTACRAVREAHGRHEFRLLQRRHLVALQLSDAPITSADRLADRRWPTRRRAVLGRINIVPAGAEWLSHTEPHPRVEYAAVFIPDSFIDALDEGARIRQSLHPLLDAELPAVRRVMQMLADELREPVYGNVLLDGALRMLLGELGRSASRAVRTGASPARLSLAQRARLDETIEFRLHEPLTVLELARDLGVSEAVLARSMRDAFGLTPYQWVIERRISRARQLLVNSEMPLAMVGAECGFDDQAHFTTAFKKWVGVSPGRYRRERG